MRKIFVLLSDGECDEGTVWEAAMFSSHHKLDNLVAIIDYNKIQSLDSTENTLALEPFKDKWVSFGWNTIEVDGHDHSSLKDSFEWCELNARGRIFVIGGSQIFEECCKQEFLQNLDLLYITHFEDNYHPRDTTHSFPCKLLIGVDLVEKSEKIHEICQKSYLINKPNMIGKLLNEEEKILSESVVFTFNTYQKTHNVNDEEKQYLNLLNKILNEGIVTESRNSKVYSLFGEKMIFDLNKGFPLLTTKHVGYKTVLRELLWFISGSTNNAKLNEKNVHIWDKNSSQEFLDNRGLSYEEGDLGPVYGFQWRHFGAEYNTCEDNYDIKE